MQDPLVTAYRLLYGEMNVMRFLPTNNQLYKEKNNKEKNHKKKKHKKK